MQRILFYNLCLTLILVSCSSSELVENWKNPEIETFEANKVLVIGITSDQKVQIDFENKLSSALNKKGINAIKSYDFFDESFTIIPKTEEALMELEAELLLNGFDAILLSKVIGVSDRVTVVSATRKLDHTFKSFKEDYYENQNIYRDEDYFEEYQVFHAESSLYCICPEKEKELIWKGSIDVTEPENIKKSISDYVKVLIWALSEQKLLILNE